MQNSGDCRETTTIGAFIRCKREAKALSLRCLARECQVSHAFLRRIECGECGAPERLLLALARRLDCDSDEMLLKAGVIPRDVLSLLQAEPGLCAELRARRKSPVATGGNLKVTA